MRPLTTPTKLVAVVVPLSLQTTLTPDEQVSVRQCAHFLSRYDKYFVAPPGIPAPCAGFAMKRLPRKYFGSAAAHARMITTPAFFEAFGDYEYILMYHTDALVLSDQLAEWCAKGFDYIGPPWLPCPDSPWVTEERVGNSGFALMKVASFLRVLYSPVRQVDLERYWQDHYAHLPALQRWRHLPKRWLKQLPWFNNVRWHIYRWMLTRSAADIFWSTEAQHYYPSFKIATPDDGLQFAFEVAPRQCLVRTAGRLPFGCHAWAKYDRAFWEPYLIREEQGVRG